MDPNIYNWNIENQNEETKVAAPQPPSEAQEPSYIRVPYEPSASPQPAATAGRSAEKPAKKPGRLPALMLAGMLALGALGGAAGAEATILLNGSNASPVSATSTQAAATTQTNTTTSAQLVAQANEATINSIYAKLSPSVVMISSVVESSSGRFGTTTGQATGTGLIVDKQGYILTNYHVIDGASSIKVEFSDGSEYTAQVVGTAQQDDLAVLKVSGVSSDKLLVAPLGNSSAVKVGDEVIAIGYPYGLEQSVTSGIVSGLDRDGSGSTNGRTLTGLIQVDAAINPGNSGGPLVNAEGQVIGINTMIESPVDGFTGVGLAIPIDHVKSLLSQLEQGGQVARPWLGIAGTEITSGLQQHYNLPVGAGILVMDVTAGGPAAQAGLQASTIGNSQNPFGQSQAQSGQVGDIITAIDGHKVTSVADLTDYLNTKQPGDQVKMTIIRNSTQQDVTVTLQAWSASVGSTSATGSNS